MYKYGISYYYMDGSIRKPRSGVDVRLLRPGQSWAEGIKLIEVTGGSGYYEISIESEAGCGYYELWDDLGSPFGQFSGKTCIIGRLDTRGLQNNSVNASHITDGSVTSSKIANGALSRLTSPRIYSRCQNLSTKYRIRTREWGITARAAPPTCSMTRRSFMSWKRSIRSFRISS